MFVDRREFLSFASQAGVAVSLLPWLARQTRAAANSADPLARLDGVAQAQAIAKGEVTALDAVDAAIARIERLNPRLNAVVADDFDRARSRAKQNSLSGPFAGVPFLIKDLDEFAGVRTSFGTRTMLGHISKNDEPYVKACVDTGVNVVGKSNTPEFGLTATTESLALGPCYNPWNRTRSSGGSSGGAGAAVAAGLVPVAQGSDGGGSIRIPASCCGVFGLKPSRGRLIGSNDEFGFSVMGVLSRSVRDTAQMIAHTERKQPAPGLKPVGLVTAPDKRRLKIGLSLKGASGQEPTADVVAAILATARLCEELGHDVRMSTIEFRGDRMAEDFLTLWSSEAGEAVRHLEAKEGRKVTYQDFEPLTLAFAEAYLNGGRERVPAAAENLQALSATVNDQMKQYDVLLCPVLSSVPPLIGEHAPTVPFEVLMERLIDYVAYTPIFNITGMPAMSVPLGWSKEGLPIGSQFAAPWGGERTLLQLAFELEQAQPWADRWPPTSAVAIPA